MKRRLLIVAGATATGKSALALELCRRLNGELINADSMQIYCGLNIGTAKPDEETQKSVAHWLLDIVQPDEDFSVSLYREAADAVISSIASRNKIPIICGGTGLYIRTLLFDYSFGETAADSGIRNEYAALARERGREYVYGLLKEVDPQSAAVLHANDLKRVIRALEIYRLSGKPKSQKADEKRLRYDYLLCALNRDRAALYERINERTDMMLKQGLEQEVRGLIQKYGSKIRDSQSMKAIGYAEMVRYIDGELTLHEATELIKKNTRNYAKRQLTYLRSMDNVVWLDAEQNRNELIEQIIGLYQ